MNLHAIATMNALWCKERDISAEPVTPLGVWTLRWHETRCYGTYAQFLCVHCCVSCVQRPTGLVVSPHPYISIWSFYVTVEIDSL